MDSIKWFFSDNTMASEELVDQFTDSKFGIDKWNSFAREIIQNSLDAVDDVNKPVEVCFDLNKNLELTDIPSGEYTKYVLEKCHESASNPQTKKAYSKGLETLNSNKIYCLKVSDYNTVGVKSGRNQAWGALVFDEGKSVKQRSGAAGSHGVGKKAPFIISNINTVFYATKNKYDQDGIVQSDCLMQGKTVLINWKDENGVSKVPKGWFGIVDESENDPKNVIKPLNEKHFKGINPYFLRKDAYGTDVIIVGVNAYKDENGIKRNMINAVLENFFVAILQGKLIVNLFDILINKDTFYVVYEKYYQSGKDVKNSLSSSLEAFSKEPHNLMIADRKGDLIGNIDIFLKIGSDNNKKYYSIVRSHGMKIEDNRINLAEQSYSAVVITNGKKLNELLSTLENAAHDSFVTNDETIETDKYAVFAYDEIKKLVKNYVIEQTKISAEKEQELENIDEILNIPGRLALNDKMAQKKRIKKKPVKRGGAGSRSNEYSGSGGTAQGEKKHRKRNGGNGPVGEGNEIRATIFDNYKYEPYFSYDDKKYVCSFATNTDLNNATLSIFSINSDGRADDTVRNLIQSATIDGKECVIENGKIKGLKLEKEKIHQIGIKLKKDCAYRLRADLYGTEKGEPKNE